MNEILALVAQWLERRPVLLHTLASDPLRLDLPPVLGPGQATSITAGALRALAALYLEAELEQTGVLVVAEALAQARDRLAFLSVEAARRLDEMVRAENTSYERPRREAIYARVFGIGAVSRDAAVNHEFQQSFASLCASLIRIDQAFAFPLGGAPSATQIATLRFTASSVLHNLAPRHSGVVVLAAQQIHRQLQQAFAVLGDRSVMSHFQAQSMWDVLRAVLAEATPDLGRIIRRAESGVRVFDWLATVMGNLTQSSTTPIVGPGAPVFVSAAQWLEATGLTSIGPNPVERRATA